MFIAVLVVIPPNWKQPKCPSVGEWMNKLRHLYLVEHCSAETMMATAWMNLSGIMLSERLLSQEVQYCIVPFIQPS